MGVGMMGCKTDAKSENQLIEEKVISYYKAVIPNTSDVRLVKFELLEVSKIPDNIPFKISTKVNIDLADGTKGHREDVLTLQYVAKGNEMFLIDGPTE
jgi:hypothetical protein